MRKQIRRRVQLVIGHYLLDLAWPARYFMPMHSPNITKRDFLKLSAAALSAAAVGLPNSLFAAATKKKIPVGLQLYSVRNQCEKDLVGTVTQVAKIGYKGCLLYTSDAADE